MREARALYVCRLVDFPNLDLDFDQRKFRRCRNKEALPETAEVRNCFDRVTQEINWGPLRPPSVKGYELGKRLQARQQRFRFKSFPIVNLDVRKRDMLIAGDDICRWHRQFPAFIAIDR